MQVAQLQQMVLQPIHQALREQHQPVHAALAIPQCGLPPLNMQIIDPLAAGARLQASIDHQGRLVLVPSKYEPEDLFRHRPVVKRTMSLEDMEQAIAAAVHRADP